MAVIVKLRQSLVAVLVGVLAVMFGMANSASAQSHATPQGVTQAALLNATDMPVIPDVQGSLLPTTQQSLAAPQPFSCDAPAPSTPATVTYGTGSPATLVRVGWTGTGSINCTIPMAALSYNLFVVDPAGASHTVAAASCSLCASITPTNTGYACLQATQDCSGTWQQGYHVVFEAPAGYTWTSSTGPCVVSGPLRTCDYKGYRGTQSLFQLTEPICSVPQSALESRTLSPNSTSAPCYNLPPSGNLPLLTLRAINNVRASHFQGGANVDSSKGLFFSSVTNGKLQEIWEVGMNDAGAWKLNSTGYYEKTFPYSGVGVRSAQFGNSLPSTRVTLVVEQFGSNGYNEVVTMYPADA